MPKEKSLNPNSQGYTNALLEDVDSKFQTILEATAPIPKMQGQIEYMLKWERNVDLIPSIFEEVGLLRKEVEVIKEAMKLLNKHDDRLDNIDHRLAAVERLMH